MANYTHEGATKHLNDLYRNPLAVPLFVGVVIGLVAADATTLLPATSILADAAAIELGMSTRAPLTVEGVPVYGEPALVNGKMTIVLADRIWLIPDKSAPGDMPDTHLTKALFITDAPVGDIGTLVHVIPLAAQYQKRVLTGEDLSIGIGLLPISKE